MSTKAEEAIKKLARQGGNTTCPNCGTYNKFGFSSVCMKYYTFICNSCKSSHQAVSHRCKSLTMSTWTDHEVAMLQRMGGNDVARSTWLANAPRIGTHGRPKEGDSIEVFKSFIVDAYERKRYYSDNNNNNNNHDTRSPPPPKQHQQQQSQHRPTIQPPPQQQPQKQPAASMLSAPMATAAPSVDLFSFFDAAAAAAPVALSNVPPSSYHDPFSPSYREDDNTANTNNKNAVPLLFANFAAADGTAVVGNPAPQPSSFMSPNFDSTTTTTCSSTGATTTTATKQQQQQQQQQPISFDPFSIGSSSSTSSSSFGMGPMTATLANVHHHQHKKPIMNSTHGLEGAMMISNMGSCADNSSHRTTPTGMTMMMNSPQQQLQLQHQQQRMMLMMMGGNHAMMGGGNGLNTPMGEIGGSMMNGMGGGGGGGGGGMSMTMTQPHAMQIAMNSQPQQQHQQQQPMNNNFFMGNSHSGNLSGGGGATTFSSVTTTTSTSHKNGTSLSKRPPTEFQKPDPFASLKF